MSLAGLAVGLRCALVVSVAVVLAACGVAQSTPAMTAPASVLPSLGPRRTFYMAPDGADSSDGTIGTPWRTLLGASRHLTAGDTLYVRGGTYTDPGGYNWAATASGTAAAPISVLAYPGELPLFDGRGTVQQALIVRGVSHLTFAGLSFTRYAPRDNGIFLVISADHIEFLGIRGYGEYSVEDSDHFFYISHSSNVVIDGCDLDGIAGAAVHIYSGDYRIGSGASSSQNVTVAVSSLLNNGHWGILAGSGLAGALFIGNVITSRQVGIEFDSPTTGVSMSGNAISAPIGISTNLDAYGGYGPADEQGDCIQAIAPFKVGWPGSVWTLVQWQATGRGQNTSVGSCLP